MKKLFALVLLAFGWMGCSEEQPMPPTPDAQLSLQFRSHFDGAPLVFGSQWYTLASGEQVRFARIKFLLSGIRLITADSTEVLGKVPYAYFDFTTRVNEALVSFAPTQQKFVGLRFEVGVDSAANHMDPNMIPANHPLNPVNNQLHWGWADGFVFVLIEGFYVKNGEDTPFIYHIGLRNPLETIPFSWPDAQTIAQPVEMQINIAEVFRSPVLFEIAENGDFTHSGADGGIAALLYNNFSNAITLVP